MKDFDLHPNKMQKQKMAAFKTKKSDLELTQLSQQLCFWFYDLRNIYDTASTHWALSRLYFAFILPFVSTFHAFPNCHNFYFLLDFDIYIKALNFFHMNRICLSRTSVMVKSKTFPTIWFPQLSLLPSLVQRQFSCHI